MKGNDFFYLFSIDSGYYLYDYSMCIVVEISSALFDILSRYKKGEMCSKEEDAIINEFKSHGFLTRDSIKSKDNKRIAYLSFAPTYNCNFRCTYCFGKYGNTYCGTPKSFDKNLLLKMLDYFFYRSFSDVEQYRVDFVSGGEPLLGFDIIKETVEYVERFIKDTGKQVSIWLCTNASLMTNEIIEYISEHNISIGISIDGSREKNDMNRLDINGKGTYESICSGIRLIMNNSNIKKKTKNIWGLCTATNENCNFIDILKHMKSLGFQNVQIRLIRSTSQYDTSEIISQYDMLAQGLLEEFTKGNLDSLKMILNDNDQFGKVVKRVLLNELLIRRCNAGLNKITICPDGTIYPCDSLVGIQEAMLGNIQDEDWNRDLYKERTVDTINECSQCDAVFLCGGDCFYNSYMKTGFQTVPDKEYCEIQKNIINRALVLRHRMELVNEERYNLLLKEIRIRNDYSELFG